MSCTLSSLRSWRRVFGRAIKPGRLTRCIETKVVNRTTVENISRTAQTQSYSTISQSELKVAVPYFKDEPSLPLGKPRIISNIKDIREWRRAMLLNGKKVAFVPTMGALHEGHLSLVKMARKHSDIVIVSIFVNPAQFAPHEDLSKYPRTLHEDQSLLAKTPCSVVFVPQVSELYPSGITLEVTSQIGTFVSVHGKSHQMEGLIRPHFFRGVATVVTKLFNIIQPDIVVFGQKDAQQCAVVRTLVQDLCMPIQVIVGPTTREPDGLAMSSRNRYLNPAERKLAPALFRGLLTAQQAFEKGETRREMLVGITKEVVEREAKGMVPVEYVSLATPYMLQEVDVVGKEGAILSGAVSVGSTRLIDNVLLGCLL